MKDFYEQHFEDCDYCVGIHDRTDIGHVEKYELIDKHTMDAYAGMADMAYEQFKEREIV